MILYGRIINEVGKCRDTLVSDIEGSKQAYFVKIGKVLRNFDIMHNILNIFGFHFVYAPYLDVNVYLDPQVNT